MRIVIAGGTGLVGKALIEALVDEGHSVFILTRNTENQKDKRNIHYIQWLNTGDEPAKMISKADVIINLAGQSINSGRWTEERKNSILGSRLKATEEILKIIEQLDEKPKVLINASAIGIYGTSETASFTEDSTNVGRDFLAETVFKWEETAKRAETFGVRTVLCRFGIILDAKDGALPRIALPYRLYAGGTIGSGRQWVSWITLKDVVHGILFSIQHDTLSGPVNFTSPQPVRMKQFGEQLSNVLHRPHWLPVPGFALKMMLGEMSLLVLEGQKVMPEKLLSAGYTFEFPYLQEALENIY